MWDAITDPWHDLIGTFEKNAIKWKNAIKKFFYNQKDKFHLPKSS